jgi:hypothetical protein
MKFGLAEIFHHQRSVTLCPAIDYDFTRIFSMMLPGQRLVIYDVDDEFVAKIKRSKKAKGTFEEIKNDSSLCLCFTKGN